MLLASCTTTTASSTVVSVDTRQQDQFYCRRSTHPRVHAAQWRGGWNKTMKTTVPKPVSSKSVKMEAVNDDIFTTENEECMRMVYC